MTKYLIQDMTQTLRYVPFFLAIWLFLLIVVQMINIKRKKRGEKALPIMPIVSFWAYLALVVMITFWSRESGSSSKIDLAIGSSLKINNRNDALVIENILLFVPYGFCLGWVLTKRFFLMRAFLIGISTSLAIELMQLLTGRGIFQIDDIITNTLGCILGALIYRIVCKKDKK